MSHNEMALVQGAPVAHVDLLRLWSWAPGLSHMPDRRQKLLGCVKLLPMKVEGQGPGRPPASWPVELACT